MDEYFKEGQHLIWRVVKLPKNGSTLYLYSIISENFSKLYRWLPDKTWEVIDLSSNSSTDIFLQDGTNVTITGTGTDVDPYIISSLQDASSTSIDPIVGIVSTNVQDALEELKADIEAVAPSNTDLTVGNRNDTTLDVQSSTGTDATIPNATTSLSGVMTAEDKTKLEALPDASMIPSIRTTKVTLSAAQITNLDTVPVEIVPAQGVGKFIQLLGVSVHFKPGAIPFNDTEILRFRNATVAPKAQFLCSLIDLTSMTDYFGLAIPVEVNVSQIAENEPMVVSTMATTITQGDGTMDIYATYQVFDL